MISSINEYLPNEILVKIFSFASSSPKRWEIHFRQHWASLQKMGTYPRRRFSLGAPSKSNEYLLKMARYSEYERNVHKRKSPSIT